ncbi:aldo/keto reductase [Nocardiopsis algeriensis]|uniref:Aryl-alcohol dehydrogenase-like predicted oxidoreductase n=1 Tax=Nocardiopsis algeriensis TaxID=1478215 RepID=A0A841IMG0_9ACTN|nr:aldo/keto reductase [Nocardiopsis algeriensis]MBB6119843.1 aryl-alcohol dehydrogenase-like predicted oxidoreductase [Nocardiopsis algeriensis]
MTEPNTAPSAALAGTLAIGGDLPVHRMGFGAMRLVGEGAWGPPRDRDEALAVLRRAVELGVTFIDTADSYGPQIGEQIIREALYPYPKDLVVATKAGFVRTGPSQWHRLGRPEYLRQQVELSLRNLGLERIDLMQLHRIDPEVPLADQLGALVELREEGKIRHIGLSEVGVDELSAARAITPVASVQNQYAPSFRRSEEVLEQCEKDGIAFLPWAPVDRGALAGPDSPLAAAAREHGVSPVQLSLSWLLHRSPVMVPIPGTSRVAHLEENVAAAAVRLTEEETERISRYLGD